MRWRPQSAGEVQGGGGEQRRCCSGHPPHTPLRGKKYGEVHIFLSSGFAVGCDAAVHTVRKLISHNHPTSAFRSASNLVSREMGTVGLEEVAVPIPDATVSDNDMNGVRSDTPGKLIHIFPLCTRATPNIGTGSVCVNQIHS